GESDGGRPPVVPARDSTRRTTVGPGRGRAGARRMATADTDNSPREDGAPDTPTFPGLGRYHRQMLLPGVGEEGQRRLLESRALMVGGGALGTVIADLRTRAGAGTLTIVDRDVVEATNLQRQTLFDEKDAAEGVPKAEAAARKLRAINSGVRIEAVVA